ncbi:ABC transporter ATP-binding protein/permease [Tsukamurella sp. 1534]|uniref:ABC transporter ATP-binding protein/permease n=1 Tax=Tsukamurella sp. 1534 TaxID=1151061 RepID=UPI0003051723|nr:ABC transporter ATP-binding protein/permease [Tsukamurella sp. 1534]
MKMSIDWSAEWGASGWWLLKAVAITAPIFVIVLAICFVSTRWGRQFWRVSGAYFTGRDSWRVYARILLLLVSTLAAVRLSVLFTYFYNDSQTALQYAVQAVSKGDSPALQAAVDGFWLSMRIFALLAVLWVARALIDLLVNQWLVIDWRVWLTGRVVDDYLDGEAYYRNRFIDDTIDNPDQRIQSDIAAFVGTSVSLSFGAVSAVASIISFTKVLWDLSAPMTVLGVTIPRAMLWLVFVYVLVSTVIAFWIGRPLINLNFLNERLTAAYRYALVRLRDNAERVAFYHGEQVERRTLLGRFAAVIANTWAIVFRSLKFNGWNLTVSQTAEVFPMAIQAPRVFSGELTIGDVSQTGSAFRQVHDSLSFFRLSYDDFAEYRAALMRLDGLLTADAQSRDLARVAGTDADGAVRLDGVAVRTPDGIVLVDGLRLSLRSGDTMVVKGASGSGKTTLLRALARIWPYSEGEVARPAGAETLFLSQMPYLPLGDLRTALSYPAEPGIHDDDVLREALGKVFLPHLADRLDDEEDWAAVLSPGEQQRIAFARVILAKPQAVFLDEATSAVDEGLEHSLYTLIRTEVPDAILVSVAHRSTVDRHHALRLELSGTGAWEFSAL